MAGNPQIAQGTLNRLVASVVWPGNTGLNVTPSFLNKSGISLSREGEGVKYFPTMAGMVTSPEPYVPIVLVINLLKTQSLAAAYEAQWQSNALIGNGTVRPDVNQGGIGPFDIFNCGIQSVRELNFSGEDPGYSVVIGGYQLLNNSLWQ